MHQPFGELVSSSVARTHCSMRRHNRQNDNNEADAINVSPLIDVVFILLIFFIVSATFVTLPGIEVTRPQAVTGKALEKNAVIFALSGENEIKYAGSTVQLEEIPKLVEMASKDRGKTSCDSSGSVGGCIYSFENGCSSPKKIQRSIHCHP